MKAFFCSTPYQIIVSLMIESENNCGKESDIYILNNFETAEKCALKLKKLEIFNNVFFINNVELKKSISGSAISYIKRIIYYFFPKKILKSYCNLSTFDYDEIYFSFYSFIVQFTILFLNKTNKNLKVILFDDGIASYTGEYIEKKQNEKKAKVNFLKFFGFHKNIYRFDEILLIEPSLFIGKSSVPIKKIDNKKFSFNKLEKIFGNNKGINEKIIFFTQPELNQQIQTGINQIILQINNMYPDFIIKEHPREELNYRNIGAKTFENKCIPFECLYNNCKNREGKIFISYFSTACLTPKILFGENPTIIFLFKLKELENIFTKEDEIFVLGKEDEKFVENFFSLYPKGKLYLPTSIKELINI